MINENIVHIGIMSNSTTSIFPKTLLHQNLIPPCIYVPVYVHRFSVEIQSVSLKSPIFSCKMLYCVIIKFRLQINFDIFHNFGYLLNRQTKWNGISFESSRICMLNWSPASGFYFKSSHFICLSFTEGNLV